MWPKNWRRFRVTRNGIPIEDYPLKGSVNVGIQYTTSFGELEACVAAGLDMAKWDSGAYPVELKNRVVAWYRAHNLVALHTQDAVRPKQKPGENKPSRRRPRRR